MDIILPLYNSEYLASKVVSTVFAYLNEHENDRAFFVDDGSSDKTVEIVENLIKDDCRVSLIVQPYNQGKGAAIHRGTTACTSEYLCFIDGDLAYSLDHLDELRNKLKTFDVVIGSRYLTKKSQQNITPLRRIMGATFNLYVRTMLRLPFRDTQAGLKGFKRNVAQDLFAKQRLQRFAFDAELLYLARSNGYSITEILATVSDEHSYHDSSVRLLKDPMKMFWSVLRIRFNKLVGRYGSAHITKL
jgi:dolichyl-phosphate beta-glucosyltransferase